MPTPSDLSKLAQCYCFSTLEQFKSVIVYLLAKNANVLTMTAAQLADAAKCYCYNDDFWKRVVAYLLSNITGGGSVDACLVAQSGAPVTPCAFAFGLAYDNDSTSPTAGSFWFWDATGAAWVRFSV